MLNLLRRLLVHRGQSEDPAADQIRQLREDVSRGQPGSELPVAELRPVMIPSRIFSHGVWVGPYHYFEELPVSLTWAYLRPQRTMLYLSHDAVATLQQQGIDWRLKAREASTREFRSLPWTHAFRGASGEPEAVALMHDDALGPSRLLHARQFLQLFPGGYRFFVPERSIALVLAATASAEIAGKVQKVVDECFARADVPISKSGYSHESLIAALGAAGE